MRGGSPQASGVDVAVLVSKDVALADDITPRNLRVGVSKGERHAAGGFADYLQRSLDGETKHRVGTKVIKSLAFYHAEHAQGAFPHVPEVGPVPLVRLRRQRSGLA